MHAAKIENLRSMSPRERYAYFVRKVADTQIAFGLFGTGWVTAEHDGTIGIPLWPERELADACATGDWAGTRPTEITLDALLRDWLPDMAKDGRPVHVFHMPGLPGLQASVVAPSVLARDLSREAAQYE